MTMRKTRTTWLISNDHLYWMDKALSTSGTVLGHGIMSTLYMCMLIYFSEKKESSIHVVQSA